MTPELAHALADLVTAVKDILILVAIIFALRFFL